MGTTDTSQQQRSAEQISGRHAAETARTARMRSDSGAEAIVTLLATVVFGLGWALVELERADPTLDRYSGQSWTELALQRSKG